MKSAVGKRIRDLEEKVIEMEETNRKLRAEIQTVKKTTNRSTKTAIRNDNAWSCEWKSCR